MQHQNLKNDVAKAQHKQTITHNENKQIPVLTTRLAFILFTDTSIQSYLENVSGSHSF